MNDANDLERKLDRLEETLVRVSRQVNVLYMVVISIMVFYGAGFVLSLLGVMMFAGASDYIFPVGVVVLFLLVTFFKRGYAP